MQMAMRALCDRSLAPGLRWHSRQGYARQPSCFEIAIQRSTTPERGSGTPRAVDCITRALSSRIKLGSPPDRSSGVSVGTISQLAYLILVPFWY